MSRWIVVALVLVAFVLGTFMERRASQEEIDLLENLASNAASRAEIQQLQGGVSWLNDHKLSVADLEDLNIAVSELESRVRSLEESVCE